MESPKIKPQEAAKTQKPVQKTGTMQDIARASISTVNQTRRPIHKSHTLMRQAVKKPAKNPSVKPAKHNTSVSEVRPFSSSKAPKVTTHQDIARQGRAVNTKQSSLVSKFGNNSVIAKNSETQANHRVERLPVRPAPALRSVPQTTMAKSISTNPVNSILENGLRNAQSHKQTLDSDQIKSVKKSKKKPLFTKVISYGAGALAILLLAGFIGFQNIPNISMRYAAARSGISASLPGYQPSGFSMSHKIQYNPGQITISYASNSDNRGFSITQRKSSWNSDSLMSSYVATKTDQPQKIVDKGRTIFLYGENSATWVNGGIWYDIAGNSQLNKDQLIRIASSM